MGKDQEEKNEKSKLSAIKNAKIATMSLAKFFLKLIKFLLQYICNSLKSPENSSFFQKPVVQYALKRQVPTELKIDQRHCL